MIVGRYEEYPRLEQSLFSQFYGIHKISSVEVSLVMVRPRT